MLKSLLKKDLPIHNLKIISNKSLPFLQYIENGNKKAEGRVATSYIRNFKNGDLLRLENSCEYVICKVIYINFYPSFEKMLISEGLKNMLPFVDTISNGIKVYQGFPGAARVNRLGCCAIGIQHIISKLDFKIEK